MMNITTFMNAIYVNSTVVLNNIQNFFNIMNVVKKENGIKILSLFSIIFNANLDLFIMESGTCAKKPVRQIAKYANIGSAANVFQIIFYIMVYAM